MNIRKKVVAVVGAMALALAGCSNSDSSDSAAGDGDKAVVKLGIVNLPIFAPVYVAEAKGYFEEEGLDVQLETVKSGADAIPLASSGQLDAVAAGFSAGMFSAINTGLGVQVVGSMGVSDGTTPSPTDLVVSKKLYDEGLTDVEGLKGKNIGAAGGEGGTGAYLTALALRDAGLTLNDVSLTNLGNPDMPAAIANGGIDAGLIAGPFNLNAINDGDAVSLWMPPAGISGTGLLYGEDFVKSENAQKLFNALVKASADLQGEDRYSDENIQIIADATGQTPEAVKAVPLYTWEPDLAPKADQLQDMEKVWMEVGAIDYDQPQDPANYVNDTFAKNAGK